METLGHDCTIDDCRALETSLVEWKLPLLWIELAMERSLETSLVEWKRRDGLSGRIYGLSLGNFLSGMETTRDAPSRPFAHALETSLVEWKLQNDAVSKKALLDLGNFLSGMETRTPGRQAENGPALGNFLSGMETAADRSGRERPRALETSLVEWKPRAKRNPFSSRTVLGNFLSGMETPGPAIPRPGGWTLETSLVEWKRCHTSASRPSRRPWKLP